MRLPTVALVLVVAASCAGTETPPPRSDAPALAADLFPLERATAEFQVNGTPHAIRVEPSDDGASARLYYERADGAPAELVRVARRGDAFLFARGPEPGTELLRVGARPGEAWESEGSRVRFDGWERVDCPARSYDAARITRRFGPEAIQGVETWWFAPGVGLVRLVSDHRSERGSLFVDELIRSSP